ncbi:o-succinylbenzoate synthase [Thalassobacillus pellis]|uniref:o-succinylbenzoate synthase n=1 Tax=Thalassobacillus pellis TaxID=748008 RepID=UPI0019614DB3|nr:o-succinylbenzoate synthase [Thalassobacillus pellis]MBM7554777.1 O-succinylbenzoate synthase [Thalassobacillus pellis]
MNISSIHLKRIKMPLKKPFTTHAGSVSKRELIIVTVHDNDGRKGFGEVTAFSTPFYTHETIDSAWELLHKLFIPIVRWSTISHPSELADQLAVFQGNQMAKAGLESALWDLFAKQKKQSLSKLIGGTREELDVGVVLSLSDSLKDEIEYCQRIGYKRYKLKVEKYKEKSAIEQVKSYAPELPLMIDGNGTYDAEDILHLQNLDELGLMMIEQPFRPGDFYLHQQLQQKVSTPVCLDESISCQEDIIQAHKLGSCQVANIKISRVGGWTEALKLHDYCLHQNVPSWCGGMVESGISRAHNIALASLDGFTIAGDISASSRFWERDLIAPEITVTEGKVVVPEKPGIGFDVDEDYIDFLTITRNSYSV